MPIPNEATVAATDQLAQTLSTTNGLILVGVMVFGLFMVGSVILMIRAGAPLVKTVGNIQSDYAKSQGEHATYITTIGKETVATLVSLRQSVEGHDERMRQAIAGEGTTTRAHVTEQGHVTAKDVIEAFRPITDELRTINSGVQSLLKSSGLDHAAEYRALADKIDGLKSELTRIERNTLKKIDTGELTQAVVKPRETVLKGE